MKREAKLQQEYVIRSIKYQEQKLNKITIKEMESKISVARHQEL